MSSKVYHIPVLLKESVDGLNINPNGVYVDVTFGGGGHSIEILKRLKNGRLYAFDQDADAQDNVPDDPRFKLIQGNFRYILNYLEEEEVLAIDGLLADLGVSSHQFDTGPRGFSIREGGGLDMRMNTSSDKSAYQVINEYSEAELGRVFREYGEVRTWKAMTKAISAARSEKPIATTEDLIRIAKSFGPPQHNNKFMAQVFQAIRIEVNDEMTALEELLNATIELIRPGGRLCVISYHSLEDRPVKNFIRSGHCDGKVNKDFFGKVSRPFEPVNKKPIVPGIKEINENKRARSARLRIATRIHGEPNEG